MTYCRIIDRDQLKQPYIVEREGEWYMTAPLQVVRECLGLHNEAVNRIINSGLDQTELYIKHMDWVVGPDRSKMLP
jgi:hypothetical protein